MDVASDGVRAALSAAAARRAVVATLRTSRKRVASVSITFLSARAMTRMNRRHLGHAGLTDVISFGLVEAGAIVGDVYISPDAARESAAAHRVTVREELTRLVVHGTLHVLGWDHPEGERRLRSAMWKRQERLVAQLRAAAR